MNGYAMILVHESTNHWQSRGDGIRAAGRDSAQHRGPIRSSVARSVARCARDELSGNGSGPGRRATERRILGASIRSGRIRRIERGGTTRAAITTEQGGTRSGGSGPAEEPFGIWTSGTTLGWPALIRVPEGEFGRNPARPTVPTAVPPVWFPTAQTSAADCVCRPANAGGTQKNSENSQQIRPLISGQWMRSIFSSMAVVAGCGCRLKYVIQYASMPRPARASATSARYGFETESFATHGPADDSTLKPAGRFFATCGESVRVPEGGWSLSRTMRSTITRRCTPSGARSKNQTLCCIFCHHTARNSILSSACGNCFADCVCTTDILLRFPSLPNQWMRNWEYGQSPMQYSSGSVPCKIMRKEIGRCV